MPTKTGKSQAERGNQNKYFEFEVSLLDIEPKIWRRFLLAGKATFRDLHEAIQDAGDWDDYHLFEFVTDRGRNRVTIAGLEADKEDMFFDDEPPPPAGKVRLSPYFDRANRQCMYRYDFGDGWQVRVKLKRTVESPEKVHRRLLDGARAFPLEDCGGVWGYYDCLAALGLIKAGDLKAKDLAERREWIGDWNPEGFDLALAKKQFDK